jgi:CcmD family protein
MGYLWAGYVITWVAVAWFAWRLESRARDVARRLQKQARGGANPSVARSENESVRT